MTIGQAANHWGSKGLEKGEERAEGTTKEYDVIARVDGTGKSIFVGVEVVKDTVEQGGWRWVLCTVERQ